jgi:arginine deiminase
MEPIFVSSEITKLQKVIVHRPDEGIARIGPRRAEELLFDDIVYLPTIQNEHDIFTGMLQQSLGKENVLFIHDLLLEALNADQARQEEVIARIIDFEELPSKYIGVLAILDNKKLTDALITGYLADQDLFLFDPIPNFIFTRDIAVTINDHVVVTKASKEARFRENFLTRFIFYAHPMFEDLRNKQKIINMNDVELFPPSRHGEKVSIEGGDIMILNRDYVLAGCSERTTAHGIQSLKEVLFEKGIIKNLVQVNIPAERSYMHIDTVMTLIREDHVVCYRPLVFDGLSSYVTVYRINGDQQTYYSVKDFILSEINPDMKFIFSGGGISPYQEREQWTDGCNLLALKSGVAVGYDRNQRTLNELKNHGYRILPADYFTSSDLPIDLVENTIITLPSNELSRARGGSHCMTLPICRRSE